MFRLVMLPISPFAAILIDLSHYRDWRLTINCQFSDREFNLTGPLILNEVILR